MAQPTNQILSKMLDRLFAAMVNGPSLNCRPHASRQRIDLTHLARLGDLSPEEVLRGVLAESRQATLRAALRRGRSRRKRCAGGASRRRRSSPRHPIHYPLNTPGPQDPAWRVAGF